MFQTQNRSELLTIPLALFGSLIIQTALPSLCILWWLASLPFHECGHAFLGNLSGQISVPTPFYTVRMGPAQNWMLIFTIAVSLVYAIYLALHRGQVAIASLCAATLTIQIIFCFILSKNITSAAVLFAGLASELLGSVFVLLLFHVPMPERFNWKLNRYFFLVLAALTFTKAARLWIEAASNPSVLPFGAAIDFGLINGAGSDGDLDRLIREFAWSQEQIISVYQITLCLSVLILISTLSYLFFRHKSLDTNQVYSLDNKR